MCGGRCRCSVIRSKEVKETLTPLVDIRYITWHEGIHGHEGIHAQSRTTNKGVGNETRIRENEKLEYQSNTSAWHGMDEPNP